MGIQIDVSMNLKHFLNNDGGKGVRTSLRRVYQNVGRQVLKRIQTPGFAPRDTGRFANEHQLITESDAALIVSTTKAQKGVPLWIYITNGHVVLDTERSRNWWFWYLNNVLGGSYTRKTNGPPGYVPPDNYHKRAVAATPVKQIIGRMIKDLIK